MSGPSQYILGKRIARGGMAEIFLAKAIGEDGFQRICAVKRILPQYAHEKEFVEMFRDEAHIGKRLQHGNIVQVYDFKEVEASWAIIMEFIDGSDLRSILMACETARNKLNVAMVCHIIAEAARGLHYAHTKSDDLTGRPLNIVHRDISPQNILISFEGEVKVTDFGIADAEQGHKNSETKPGVVKGKYSYMSPEQLAAKELDARSDVFSLAIVMWECLAMRRLFHGESDLQIIKKVQECDIPVNLKQLNSEVDDELLAIVMKGLSKDRKVRQQTSLAFEKDLKRYLNTRFPDFTPTELSTFLKQLLKTRRLELSDDIRKTLTTEIPAPSSAVNSTDGEKASSTGNGLVENSRLSEGQMMLKVSDAKGLDSAFVPKRPPGSNAYVPSNKGIYTGYKTGVARYNKREQTQSKILLGIVAALCLTMALGATIYLFGDQINLSAFNKPNVSNIVVESIPERVRVIINDQDIGKGKFVSTPIKIPAKAGNYKIKIQRPGYIEQSYTIDVSDQKDARIDRVILKKDPKTVTAPTRIDHNPQGKSVTIVVNQGMEIKTTPFALGDIPLNNELVLDVYPNFPDTKSSFRCKLFPRPSSSTQPFLIRIDAINDKVSCIY